MKAPLKVSKLAGGLMLALPAGFIGFGLSATAQAETTITAVMQAPLRSLDPVITTAMVVRNYGYMVYDTLLSRDAKGNIKPQMLEKWTVSPDGKTYTFTLRNGLKWDDGTPVTAADCIASIKRWATQDKTGQILMGLTTSIKKINDKSFSMTFSSPTNLVLRALSKPSGLPPFMMPERVAKTSPSVSITSSIGSGPFKFVKDKYKPGVQAVFVKNKEYVPRTEAPSGLAGGHVVKVDKVRWISMPDAMSTINAIKSGEIDFIEQVRYDLLPLLEHDKNIQLIPSRQEGGQVVMRLNFTQPPFNNKLVRQAAMAAIDQKQIMQADVGNPKYYRTCAALFGCSSKYASTVGAQDLVKADPAKSKALLKKAGYHGTPVVIMQPTNFPNAGGSFVPVIAQELRQGGFKVKVAAMDWQTEVNRRASRKPVSEGGWNILTTYFSLSNVSNPLSYYAIAANGDKAWFGWPTSKKIVALRKKFALASDPAELKSLADKIQKAVYDDVVIVPLGEFSVVSAARTSLKHLPKLLIPAFWGVEKVGK